MKKILFWALCIRLILVPFAFHSDLTTNSIWGIYAKEFGLVGYYDWLNFGNYAIPEYPPLSTILFLVLRWIYEFIFSIFWKINISLKLFPSLFITWLDNFGYASLLKLPGIFADVGIGYLIYRYTKKTRLASLYLFNPAVIYLSSLWGQTESFVGFFALFGLILILSKRYLSGAVALFISFMTKATMLPLVPISLIQMIKNKITVRNIVVPFSLVFLGAFALGYMFTDHVPIYWLLNTYKERFITGPHNLEFINLNAFNFWSLLLGMSRISDKVAFLGVSLFQWGWIVFLPFLITVLYKFTKTGNLFFACLLIFYAAFLFLPRMHERYLYPIFIFFPFILLKIKKLMPNLYIASFIFLVNLYHWWPVPNIYPLFTFFDLEITERVMSLANLANFGHLIWKYRSS